ncbi:MAG: SurA N-terminal domain-containing protein [Verrucomicrobiota bacterium]|nr:SurA N-terminal domain-containing protein [Verrucomicrobiota bacterium]
MINVFRRYQQGLMIVVTVLVIIAFAWLYNDTRMFDRIGADTVGSIYGRPVTQAEYLRESRKFDICYDLRMGEFLESMIAGSQAQTRDAATSAYVWNSLILRHEAEALGIQPTDDDVVEAIQKLPAFHTNGAFDPNKYNAFVQRGLTPRGFTPEQLEELMRDQLRLEKIKDLLGATVAPVPSEIRSAYERGYQKTELSVIRWKLDDFNKEIKIAEEDLKKRFEEQKDQLKSPEKRKVKFVAFTLPEPEKDKPLAGKERVAAMQKLADRATEFSVAMAENGASFEEVAKKFDVPVQETPEFAMTDPPPALGNSEIATQAAFSLARETPNSDVVTTDSGYYVLQLAGLAEARPLAFEEARGRLTEELTQQRAFEALSAKAKEARAKVEAEMKAGKSVADAAQAAGVKAEPFPPFSMAEQPKRDQPDAQDIVRRSQEMKVGELSDFVPTGAGGLLLHVHARPPVDETLFEKEKPLIADSLDRMQREVAFQQWLKDRRTAAGVVSARG